MKLDELDSLYKQHQTHSHEAGLEAVYYAGFDDGMVGIKDTAVSYLQLLKDREAQVEALQAQVVTLQALVPQQVSAPTPPVVETVTAP